MSSDVGKRKRQNDEELIRAAEDTIQKKKKFQNNIRCKRYREKKKNEAINSKISKHRTLTVEEQEKIKHRQEQNKKNSQRYRDRKRAINLINSQRNQNTVVKCVPNYQNFHNSQIAGPSTKNVQPTHTASLSMQNAPYIPESHTDYDDEIDNDTLLQANFVPQVHEPIIIINYNPNTQNIQPCDVQNNTQDMHFQLNLQTYSSFQQNSSAHREFQKDFFDNDFGHACEICDRLWFKKDLKIIVNNDATPNIQLIRTLLTNVNVTEVKICFTCLLTIKKNCIPPLSVFNGFKYPPFPENLKKFPLDLVTERFVSPRIPFMQIRRLRHIHGQFGIYGQVINVPIEINTMVHSLPRNVDDDHSITVHIKRRKIHKSSYVYGIVNKRKIKVWLRYLIDTPVYTFYGITVDDSFLNDQDDAQDEFVYDGDGYNNISEQISIEECLIAQQQTLMWNDEMYLRIAPGEGNIPISLLFDEHAEELSFPQIYLGQFRTFRDGFTVTPYMMATSELRRSDRRGVTPQHLLYLAMKIMRIRIRDSLSIVFKHIGKGTTVTKEQIESENYIQGCIESNFAFLRKIPNSAYYWSARKKDLFAMIRQYGKPTIFFTISANEIGWPKLLQLLYKLKNNSEISVEDAAALHFIEKSTLINEDAVTCAIYFNKLVNVLLKILQSKRFSPFKKYRILYYFKRIEFEHGGSPHAHILAWLDNAPEDALEKDYNQAIDLIDFLISVSATEASGNIELQTHKHTLACYEGLASKRMQTCRFEAPFMPIKSTMILTPMKDTEDGFKEYKAKYNALRKNLENYEYDDFHTFYQDNNINSDEEYFNIIRAGINRPRVFPKRQPHEKWHNPFNPFMLNIVKSNTDFQFITEEYSCATYVVEYVNKTKRCVSNLQRKIIEIMDEHPEFGIFEITKNLSINLLNYTEITSQEAAWYLLREPLSKSSTIITYIPTVWPVERHRIKKTMKELSELDEDCTDIWKENWFDKYQKRPENLENISLAQFVSQYFKHNKGEYVKRDEPRVIRYRNYDMATDFNEYKREMVTLHIPFRHEEVEILEEMKFIRIYEDNVDLILQKRKEFESNIDIERTLQICRELCREDNPDNNEEIRDVVGRLPDHNPFQELYNDPNAEINDGMQLAMLNELGAIAKKIGDDVQKTPKENMEIKDTRDINEDNKSITNTKLPESSSHNTVIQENNSDIKVSLQKKWNEPQVHAEDIELQDDKKYIEIEIKEYKENITLISTTDDTEDSLATEKICTNAEPFSFDKNELFSHKNNSDYECRNKMGDESRLLCNLSNTLNVLSDDEDDFNTQETQKIESTFSNSKQCINLKDNDVMLVDEELLNKTNLKDDETKLEQIEESNITREEKCNEELKFEDKNEIDTENKTESDDIIKKFEAIDLNYKKDNLVEAINAKPHLPSGFLKTCKKKLSDMTRNDLEEFCILKIVESIVDRSSLSKIETQLKNMKLDIEKYEKKATMLEKQNRDLQNVLKAVQEQQKKTTNVPITPLKITRSVGMQVSITDKPGVRRRNLTGINSNTISCNINVSMDKTNRNPPVQKKQKSNNQQVPVPRIIPAANNVGSKIDNTLQATPNTSQKDDEPPSKIDSRASPIPRIRLVPPEKLMAPQRQPFETTVDSPRKVYIPISEPQSPNCMSGQVVMLKSVANQGPIQRCSPPNCMVEGSLNNIRINKMRQTHPAPLPDALKQYQPPNWKALPPAPDLKLSEVENGIVISWNIDGYQSDSYEEIDRYQLYAYQETTAPPSTTLWKKIGDVKALPLPMACTLTQFEAGYEYFFAVRAVDVKSRLGPFSLPGSIFLLNKI